MISYENRQTMDRYAGDLNHGGTSRSLKHVLISFSFEDTSNRIFQQTRDEMRKYFLKAINIFPKLLPGARNMKLSSAEIRRMRENI